MTGHVSEPLTLAHLRHRPIDSLSRDLEERLAAKLAPHRIGDPWPEITVNDWCVLAGLALRIIERLDRDGEK